APQFLTGIRVPAIEEPARGGFSAGHSRNQHSVGYDRPARGVEAVFGIGEFLVPELLAGFHVDAEHVIVDRHAKDFDVINRRSAPVKSRPSATGFDLGLCAPDLPDRLYVD